MGRTEAVRYGVRALSLTRFTKRILVIGVSTSLAVLAMACFICAFSSIMPLLPWVRECAFSEALNCCVLQGVFLFFAMSKSLDVVEVFLSFFDAGGAFVETMPIWGKFPSIFSVSVSD